MFNVTTVKDVKLKIAELVKILRKQEKITQEQLAVKLGLSRITIKNLEAGQNATLDTVFKVFQYFDMLEVFLGVISNEITNRSYESLY